MSYNSIMTCMSVAAFNAVRCKKKYIHFTCLALAQPAPGPGKERRRPPLRRRGATRAWESEGACNHRRVVTQVLSLLHGGAASGLPRPIKYEPPRGLRGAGGMLRGGGAESKESKRNAGRAPPAAHPMSGTRRAFSPGPAFLAQASRNRTLFPGAGAGPLPCPLRVLCRGWVGHAPQWRM